MSLEKPVATGENLGIDEQQLGTGTVKKDTADIFSVEGVDHDINGLYGPKFFDKGGEHAVYEVEGHQKVLAKVNIDTIRAFVARGHKEGLSINEMSSKMKYASDIYIEEDKKRQKILVEVFGSEHVPKIRKFVMKVPVTEDTINELFKDQTSLYFGSDKSKYPKELNALVSIQEKVKRSQDADVEYVLSGYAEKTDVFEDDYVKQTQDLVFKPNDEGVEGGEDKTPVDFDKESFLRAQHVPYLRHLFKNLDKRPMLFDAVLEFLHKTIRYVEMSGEVLDIVGRGNVAFIPGRKECDYQLIDALYPSGGLTILEIKKSLLNFREKGDSISEQDINNIYNGLNFVRTINGLAAYMKLDVRLSQFDGMDVDCRDLLKMLQARYKTPA